MNIVELRDLDETRTFLIQGLWFQRAAQPDAVSARLAIEWAREIAARGTIPPIGFVADLGLSLFGHNDRVAPARQDVQIPGLPGELLRAYEDYVLGKLFADASFDRGADAMRRYQGRDQARCLAFILERFQERSGFRGSTLNPAVLKTLSRESAESLLHSGWQSCLNAGVMPELVQCYESLINAVRKMAEILGPEDVFELEHGTALSAFGQRLALRQVLTMVRHFQERMPRHPLQPPRGQHEALSRILDEDTYPVGGFASLSTRGSIESLLHSQLAFMEDGERPDLFDIKFLRDELLYYSRDENTFLRRRRSYFFALFPGLAHARFKDKELPYQRLILALALIVTIVHKLSDWLSEDALQFTIAFVDPHKNNVLAAERELLEMLFREEIENGTVVVETMAHKKALAKQCAMRARRSLCHCLLLDTNQQQLEAEGTLISQLLLQEARPRLVTEGDEELDCEANDALDHWINEAAHLLQLWV